MTEMHPYFASRIRVLDDGCWEWIKSTDGTGYGKLYHDGRLMPAHRRSYELHVGPIPDGLNIDHLCFNRRCVNPEHLEPVTQLENVRRSVAAGRNGRPMTAACVNGHTWTAESTYQYAYRRVCKICIHIRSLRYRGLAA